MFWLLLACTDTQKKNTEQWDYDPEFYIDLRKDVPEPPENGLTIASPIFEIPPYTEIIYCYFDSYKGETTGVNFMQVFEADNYAHHNQLKIATTNIEDGTLLDCNYLDNGTSMSDFVPLFEAVGVDASVDAQGNWLQFPEGIATRLNAGQKWVLEMHYLNTSDKIAVVNSAVNLGFLPAEDVESWAGSAQFDSGPPQVHPGIDTDTFDCEWPEPVTVLSLSGHMHSTGTKFSVEHIKTDGSSKEIYAVNEWDGGYHPYFPVILNFHPGELEVEPGDIFRTHCEWNNPTDQILTFPAEMCTTAVVAYPLNNPISCIDGVYSPDSWQ